MHREIGGHVSPFCVPLQSKTVRGNESDEVVTMFELLLTEQRRGSEETERSNRGHDVLNT